MIWRTSVFHCCHFTRRRASGLDLWKKPCCWQSAFIPTEALIFPWKRLRTLSSAHQHSASISSERVCRTASRRKRNKMKMFGSNPEMWIYSYRRTNTPPSWVTHSLLPHINQGRYANEAGAVPVRRPVSQQQYMKRRQLGQIRVSKQQMRKQHSQHVNIFFYQRNTVWMWRKYI